jgi:predicted transposase/invertase (TIGR01784 family)
MNKELLSPLMDYVVKVIFGDQKNIANTKGFLKTVLDLPEEEYDHLTISDPILKRWRQKDKMGILDVKVHTRSGRIINVEVQVKRLGILPNRIVYYLSKMISEQLKSGFNYKKIHQTISVVIYDQVLFPEEKGYLNTYELRNPRSGKLFTDLLKVVILELPKVPAVNDGSPIWPWLAFFKTRKLEDFEMLAKKYPEVGGAVVELKRLSWSERHRMIADSREKLRRDNAAMMEEAREEGLAEGEAKGLAIGEAKGQRETARRMKTMGLPIDTIATATGLSPEEIKDI